MSSCNRRLLELPGISLIRHQHHSIIQADLEEECQKHHPDPSHGCEGLPCAVHLLACWTISLETGSDAPACAPHHHLASLIEALNSTSNSLRSHDDVDASMQNSPSPACAATAAAAILSSSCKSLMQGLQQLAAVTEAAVSTAAIQEQPTGTASGAGVLPTAAAAPPLEAAAVAHAGLHRASLQSPGPENGQTEQGSQDAAAPMDFGSVQQLRQANAAGHFKLLLFWACHLTIAIHKFITTAQLSKAPSGRNASKTAARAAAAAAAAAGNTSHHSLPAQQVDRWLQQVLPDAVQHLLACYSQLTRCTSPPDSSDTSSVASAVSPSGRCCLQLSAKDCATADKLLYSVCLALLGPDYTPSTQKASKPPKKQPRRVIATNTRSNSTPYSTSLSPRCTSLAISMLGCHLVCRHQLQLQLSGKQQGGVLADPHMVHLQPLIPQALIGLLTDPCTCSSACQMLCMAAEAIFPSNPQATQLDARFQQQQIPRKRRSKTQQPVRGRAAHAQEQTAAASSGNGQSSMQLLELLAALLSSTWPAPSPATTTAAAAARPNSDIQKQLLAAAMLPRLFPASVSSVIAARKHWLTVVAAAGLSPPPGTTLQLPSAAATAASSAGEPVTAGEAHATAVALLAAAVLHDRDANVRSKALGLLHDLARILVQQWALWSGKSHQEQQQGRSASKQQADASRPLPHVHAAGLGISDDGPTGNAGSDTTAAAAAQAPQVPSAAGGAVEVQEAAAASAPTRTFSRLQGSIAALIRALQSQLLGSSKACRLKALQVLQQLLQPRTANSSASNRQHSAAVLQLQQKIVCEAYPTVCQILATGQHSSLHCLNCKAAAQELLPAMAAVLQPEQALRLALTCTVSGITARGAGAISEHNPAAQLLASLTECHERQLYKFLQDLILSPETTTASAGAAVGEPTATAGIKTLLQQLQQLLVGFPAREALRRHAFMQVCQSLTGAADPGTATDDCEAARTADSLSEQAAGSPGDSTGRLPLLQVQQALLLAVQLLEVAGGGCGTASTKDFRGELAILADALDLCCMWLKHAKVAATSAADVASASAGASKQGKSAATAITAASSGRTDNHTPSQEMPNGTMGQSADTANGTEDGGVVGQQQSSVQPETRQRGALQDSCSNKASEVATTAVQCFGVCQELLGSLLRLLEAAAAAAEEAAAAKTAAAHPASAANLNALSNAGPASHAAAGHGWCSPWMWDSIGCCLSHHLDDMVLLSAACSAPVRLPVGLLSSCIKVLCLSNRGRQLLLHQLLLSWHKELAQDNTPAAAAAVAPAKSSSMLHHSCAAAVDAVTQQTDRLPAGHGKLVPFLLLIQHLLGFYKLEQAWFRQQLVNALKASTLELGVANADGTSSSQQGGCDAAQIATLAFSPAGAADCAMEDCKQQGQQQQQQFNYMLGEEEAACIEASTARFTANLLTETAPACYLPLLLQLVQDAAAPVHIKVLSLQALQPLLLVSADLANQHMSSVASLLTTSNSAGPLLLQAVATAGALIAARPAQSAALVGELEHLLLYALGQRCSTDIDAVVLHSPEKAAAAGPSGLTTERQAPNSPFDLANSAAEEQQQQPCLPGLAAAAVAAMTWYSELLLNEKLLLTGRSWGILAAGLLGCGEVQGVSAKVQQLTGCLINQQRMPRCKVALGLLLNYPPAPAASRGASPAETLDTTPQGHPAAAGLQADGGMVNSSGGMSTGGPGSSNNSNVRRGDRAGSSRNSAVKLVQQLLGFVLTPQELLASDELMLPLLQPLASSSRDAVAAAAALLAACTPTARCLDALLRMCQAQKHSMALSYSPTMLADLTTFVSNYSSSSGSRSRQPRKQTGVDNQEGPDDTTAARAAIGHDGSAQAKLLQLLQDITTSAAVSAAATIQGDSSHAGRVTAEDETPDGDGRGQVQYEQQRSHRALQAPRQKRSRAAAHLLGDAEGLADGTAGAEALQGLLQQRQADLQQLRARNQNTYLVS